MMSGVERGEGSLRDPDFFVVCFRGARASSWCTYCLCTRDMCELGRVITGSPVVRGFLGPWDTGSQEQHGRQRGLAASKYTVMKQTRGGNGEQLEQGN